MQVEVTLDHIRTLLYYNNVALKLGFKAIFNAMPRLSQRGLG